MPKRLYEAYRTIGLTREDMESGSYIRLKHIQRLLKAGLLDASLRWRPKVAGTAAVA